MIGEYSPARFYNEFFPSVYCTPAGHEISNCGVMASKWQEFIACEKKHKKKSILDICSTGGIDRWKFRATASRIGPGAGFTSRDACLLLNPVAYDIECNGRKGFFDLAVFGHQAGPVGGLKQVV